MILEICKLENEIEREREREKERERERERERDYMLACMGEYEVPYGCVLNRNAFKLLIVDPP